MSIILEEASNGCLPNLITGAIKQSRTYCLELNGWELARLERFSKGIGLQDFILHILQDSLRTWNNLAEESPSIQSGIDQQELELTGAPQ